MRGYLEVGEVTYVNRSDLSALITLNYEIKLVRFIEQEVPKVPRILKILRVRY